MRIRSLIGALLFSLMLIGGFRPGLVRLLASPRAPLSRYFATLPDRAIPQYPEFIARVAAATARGERIAILVDSAGWHDRYDYAFFRATYLLAGRHTVPLMSPNGDVHPERLASSDAVASWNVALPADQFRPVLRHAAGTLYRKQ